MFTKYFGQSVVALAFALATPACTAAIDSSEEGTREDQIGATKDFVSCNVDRECVAVPRVQCCPNGILEAVNASKVDAYKQANVCKNMPILCPQHIILDTRVAQCNTVAKKCEMVVANQPDIGEEGGFCGGFAGISCKANLACKLSGNFPDAGGICEKADKNAL